MADKASSEKSSSNLMSLFSHKRYFVNNLDSYHGEFVLKELVKILENNLILPASGASTHTYLGEEVEMVPPPPQQPYEIIGKFLTRLPERNSSSGVCM